MEKRAILVACLSLTINGSALMVSAPASAMLPFCVEQAMTSADNSGYPRDSPQWQESYDLWLDACEAGQPPVPDGDVPCTRGKCGEWPGDS